MACRSCELACAVAHADTDDLVAAIEQGARPRIFIEAAGRFAVPLQCRHCEDAPCARVCPSGALSRPSVDEPVLIDQERCIGCGFCVQACPFGVVRLAPGPSGDKKAVIKCDLCVKRQAEGLQPACVAACPVKALSFAEVEENAKQARRAAASELARASLHVVRPEG
jgi:carbon-monoxide dehydrogenase iron sulfur subunit